MVLGIKIFYYNVIQTAMTASLNTSSKYKLDL